MRLPRSATFVTTLLLATAALLATPSPTTAAVRPEPVECQEGPAVELLCGLPAPEDLVRVPGSDWVVVSSLAEVVDPGSQGAGLSAIDTEERTARPLTFTAGEPRAPYDGCTTAPEPDLSTHGMDIRSQGPGRSTLFVVGHGAREAVEVFDVRTAEDGGPALTWIGCVPAPVGAFLNAVVALPDGRLVVTVFFQSPATFDDVLAGRPTGAVHVWEPGGAFAELPGTRLSGPNGVAVTDDERYVVVAESGTSRVLRYRLDASQEPPVVVTPGFRTDNLREAPDGRLLLAGPRPDPGCDPGADGCAETSVVAALDPYTYELATVVEIPPQPGFSELSSALVVEDDLWLGAASGDCVIVTAQP